MSHIDTCMHGWKLALAMAGQYSVSLDPSLVEPPPRPFRSTTVLTRAIISTASRQAKYLLERGCDPNGVVSSRKLSPLMVACFVEDRKKRKAIFKSLMQHGADPTLEDLHGRNSIMYACALGLVGETKLMVKDCDYNLNATDRYGDTALHMCAKEGSTRVLTILLREMLKHRMDVSVQNHEHLSPLSLAILNGNLECARILHTAGACPRFSKSKWHSVLWVSCTHRERVSSAGLKAVNDSKMVGQAFGAIKKRNRLNSAGSEEENRDTTASPWEGEGSVCSTSPTPEGVLRLPQLLPLCEQQCTKVA